MFWSWAAAAGPPLEISGDCELHSAGALASAQAAAAQAAMMEQLRSWQALVSLWDRMDDRSLHMHEAPSTFEIGTPAREGWLMRRSKSGVFVEWRRQWAVLKRAHLFLFDRPDSPRPSTWHLMRKADVQVRGGTSGQKHVLQLVLSHRRKVVLAYASPADMQGWHEALCRSVALGTSDPRACRPLQCAPAIVKQRALGGIPDCFRGIVWQKLSGADVVRQRHPDRYKALLGVASSADPYIRRDLRRTMPKNAFFKEDGGGEGHARGQQLLFNVVHAYAVHDSEVGYSQGINFLAAVLLLHMKQEQAFWVLVQLMRRYRLRGLFQASNPQLALEHFKLQWLTKLCTPALHQLFTEQGVDISALTSEWLITVFSYTFPLSFTFRVWDGLLVKGFSYILQVAVAILRAFECQLLSLTFESIVFFLREIPTRLAKDVRLAEAVLVAAHKVTWDYDVLEAEAKEFVAACVARDKQRAVHQAQEEAAACQSPHVLNVVPTVQSGAIPAEERADRQPMELAGLGGAEPAIGHVDDGGAPAGSSLGPRDDLVEADGQGASGMPTSARLLRDEALRDEAPAAVAAAVAPAQHGAVYQVEPHLERQVDLNLAFPTTAGGASDGAGREAPTSPCADEHLVQCEEVQAEGAAQSLMEVGMDDRRRDGECCMPPHRCLPDKAVQHSMVRVALGGVGGAVGGAIGGVVGSTGMVLKSASNFARAPLRGLCKGLVKASDGASLVKSEDTGLGEEENYPGLGHEADKEGIEQTPAATPVASTLLSP